MLYIQKGAISPKSLHIATSDLSHGQNWCRVFKKVQYCLCLCICVFKKVQYRLIFTYCYIRYITRTKLVFCFQKGAISPMSLHMCIQNGAISPKSLHIAASDISQGQTRCCVFKTVQYRPMSLHIAASDISQDQNWCCIFKKVQYRLKTLHIATSDISHGYTVGVVHSKRCNIALCLCILHHPMSLHIATSDISQGQNWCCVFKTVQYRLCICIFLRLIYHKNKTGFVYSKRWNITFVFANCCV